MAIEIEKHGTITGPKDAFGLLPPAAFRLKSWADAASPRLQDEPRRLLRAAGFNYETVPAHKTPDGKKWIHELYVYRTREEREACFAFHRPAPEPEKEPEGFYWPPGPR